MYIKNFISSRNFKTITNVSYQKTPNVDARRIWPMERDCSGWLRWTDDTDFRDGFGGSGSLKIVLLERSCKKRRREARHSQ
ncbi:hypothetical protein B9Z55_000468 [Caenorhabditis nigoni]|uniref:Uncharacterized protein n=1 Tax=Caenorhabditis nigoni TaxID=1611254 RepID=A0A2G5VTB1_9PELO|nr:hypothetical protein B9Z55_000468 [Caenorhabditis nigoni]